MKEANDNSDSRIDIELPRAQLSEDPRCEPFEKQTAWHLEGDANRATITSSKQVVYGKCLRHPEFELKWLNVYDENHREYTVPSLNAALDDPELTIIGATGTIPASCLSIGAPRNSNSHARIVIL